MISPTNYRRTVKPQSKKATSLDIVKNEAVLCEDQSDVTISCPQGREIRVHGGLYGREESLTT